MYKFTKLFSFSDFIAEKVNKEPDIQDANLADFYKTLEDAVAANMKFSQQGSGSYTYSKEVENVQAGLNFLGYDLPRYGVDGLFGPETGDAVARFKKDHPFAVKLGRAIFEKATTVGGQFKVDLENGPSNHGGRALGNWQSDNAWDLFAPPGTTVNSYTIGTVKKVRDTNKRSGKVYGTQVTIGGEEGYPDIFYTHLKNVKLQAGDKVALGDFIGEICEWEDWPSGTHVHIGLPYGTHLNSLLSDSDKIFTGVKDTNYFNEENIETIDAKFIKALISMLKKKNFSTTDIKKKYVTSASTVALSSQEDEAFYEAILASLGAKSTPEKIKFLKAWRQAEGGKAKNNPFNTTKKMPVDGVTNYNSVGVKNYPDRQTGLEATVKTLTLPYYSELLSKLRNDNITAQELAETDDLSTWGTGQLVSTVLRGKSINPPPIYT